MNKEDFEVGEQVVYGGSSIRFLCPRMVGLVAHISDDAVLVEFAGARYRFPLPTLDVVPVRPAHKEVLTLVGYRYHHYHDYWAAEKFEGVYKFGDFTNTQQLIDIMYAVNAAFNASDTSDLFSLRVRDEKTGDIYAVDNLDMIAKCRFNNRMNFCYKFQNSKLYQMKEYRVHIDTKGGEASHKLKAKDMTVALDEGKKYLLKVNNITMDDVISISCKEV